MSMSGGGPHIAFSLMSPIQIGTFKPRIHVRRSTRETIEIRPSFLVKHTVKAIYLLRQYKQEITAENSVQFQTDTDKLFLALFWVLQ